MSGGMEPEVEGTHGPQRLRPSSYRALRSAVSSLARIDDFICEKIGSGFFSEVFKVKHRVTGQIMALKMNTMASNRANMLKEVQLMNRLCHPNILRFVGVCVHEGHLHALTEYINGGNLEQLLDSDVFLSWAMRIGLGLDIARGLQYLHSKGIFHRDLTSKNCLVRWENGVCTAVVGDFGLAEKIPDNSDGIQKQPLSIVGSPYWMAPEVLRGEQYDEKVDVFAYGIILCEIIGRIQADPDFLPRTEDFGLDVDAFQPLAGECPPAFLSMAVTCCSMKPKCRPPFSEIVSELERISAAQQVEQTGHVEAEPVKSNSNSLSERRSSLEVMLDDQLSLSKSDASSPVQSTPARVNPFSQRHDLNGGRIKLFDTPSKSVISLTFTLPPPPDPCSPTHFGKGLPRSHRRCQSLPCTPEDIQSLNRNTDGDAHPNVMPLDANETTARTVNIPNMDSDSMVNIYTDVEQDHVFSAHTDSSNSPEEQENEHRITKNSTHKELEEGNCTEKLKDYACQADDSGVPIDLELMSLDHLTEESVEEEAMDCISSPNTPCDSPKPFTNGWTPPVSNRPPFLPTLPDLDNNNSPVQPLNLPVNGFRDATTPVTPPEQDEVVACSGCCLAGFSFPSMCIRGRRRNPYKNLNGDSATRELLCRVQPPSPPAHSAHTQW
ncbi:dual specificity testis-specific protein kinase 2 isoform X1 [Tachysurus vachellii]|uniref:dual specificity testis-specific protein kinase 2 isoform X1 n=1 Tax=Tachysurus vachellii TaxID=175792 RepID=UPI00296AEADA|nr:dual specificity testis-specific protein kinase 2 isoform X1 [Tachysurus vachellii]